ncbi:3012_t:CDS:2 [Racocetra fulgida]|uniref:3012_t:CDS:1 n=1 Tax=Racocetra fulgida TaxID=60492 RepID=A0A9N8VDE7_9GLOM|nr:3012_t:CDS:2 [Racocetra fulgida]
MKLINYEDEGENKIMTGKRFSDLVGFYRTNEVNRAEIIKENQEVNQCKYEIETQEDNIENILIIGKVDSGKSALANVISNTNEFAEGDGSVSETKSFQAKNFEWKGIKYRV